jgi:uncharacterized membrane protein YfcA
VGMNDLGTLQLILITLIFVWSGFVRSGLGFGGAVLSLPFLLLVHDDPLLYLPLISIQLLIFSSLTVITNLRRAQPSYAARQGEEGEPLGSIDWDYLKFALGVMIVPKLVGVFGVITLPASLMSGIIFAIVLVYALSYITNRPFVSSRTSVDILFLALGGYVSGTSLIGAPLIIAVFSRHVARSQLRDTLFVLWFVLVSIKMAAFLYAGIDLQLRHQLWLLPAATVGHLLGLRFHRYTLRADPVHFFRLIGSVLLLISLLGLYRAFFPTHA